VTAPLDSTLSALARLADAIESAEDEAGGRASARSVCGPVGGHSSRGAVISHARRGVHRGKFVAAHSAAFDASGRQREVTFV